MKKLLLMIAAGGLFLSTTINAEMLAVSTWKATQGGAADMFKSAANFKAAHEALGAEVRVIQSTNGTMAYAMRFDSWKDWAEFGAKAEKDATVQKLFAASQKGGWSEFLGTNMMNIIAPAEKIGTVFQTFVWQPAPGKLEETIGNAMKAKAIHTKDGIHVSVGVNSMQQMIYLTSYDDEAHFARAQDEGPSEEFQKFFAEISKNPAARLVNVILGFEQ